MNTYHMYTTEGNLDPLQPDNGTGHLYLPVTRNTESLNVVARLQIPDGLYDGDKLGVFAGLMVTNEILRARGKGVASVTQIRLVETPTPNNIIANSAKQGISIVDAAGGNNVSVQAHHMFERDNNAVTITKRWPTAYLEYLINAKSTAAIEGDNVRVEKGSVNLWALVQRT